MIDLYPFFTTLRLISGKIAAMDSFSLLLLSWIGLALLHGTILAVSTWLIAKTFGRRLRSGALGLLWTIVLVKFVIPIAPGWSLSFSSVANSFVHSIWPSSSTPADLGNSSTDGSRVEYIALVEQGDQPATHPEANSALASRIPIAAIALACYAACVCFVLARRLLAYNQIARQVRSMPRAEQDIQAVVACICERMNVHRVPDTRISDDAPAPFILGALRPRLVLSRRQLACPRETEAVILHEIAHLRRGDLIVRYLQFFAGVVFFFWPVVAWVNRRIDLARELACDDWALTYGRLSAAEYARCLVRALGAACLEGRFIALSRWRPIFTMSKGELR